MKSTSQHAVATSLLALLVPLTGAAPAQLPAQPGMERASISLFGDRSSYAPGEEIRLAVPLSLEPGWHVNSHQPTYDYLIPTELEIHSEPPWEPFSIDYPPGVMRIFAFASEAISVYEDQVVLIASGRAPEGLATRTVELGASLRYQACDDRRCLPPTNAEATVLLRIDGSGEPAHQEYFGSEIGVAGASPAVSPALPGLATFFLLGLLGGLILNAMPCVLPILSLKVLGLVESAAGGRSRVVAGALATAAGILLSFWALAGAAIAARWAGATVGWGVQFQEPFFVVSLTVVIALFSLNLWGLFEVPLPQRLAGWAEARGGEGLTSHFTAGLFATLMATPCSAPFLGTAVGFALAQSAGIILLIFSAVGLGMALPYIVLAVAPRAARWLPRPGAWMDKFKAAMGFLLAGAALWLLYVLSSQVSRERLAFIELAILGLAFGVWLRARAQGARIWRLAGGLTAGAAVAIALTLAATSTARPSGPAATLRLIDWVTFDRQEAERLARAGTPVFVDVTADWCFTCKVNERLAIEVPEVAEAFERHGVVAMKADWTSRDDRITAFLNDHGRYGIPFYLLYSPGGGHHLFSELLTRETVVRAVEEAAGGGAALARR